MKMIKQPTIPPMPKQPTFDARDTQYNLPIGTDLISRTQAIEVVQNRHMMLSKEKVLLINDLEKLPPAEPHWIPVTEEPKESGKYLVTAVISFIPDHVDDPGTYEAVTMANYLADIRGPIKWWGNNVEKVLAWMPLPEPYKGVTT